MKLYDTLLRISPIRAQRLPCLSWLDQPNRRFPTSLPHGEQRKKKEKQMKFPNFHRISGPFLAATIVLFFYLFCMKMGFFSYFVALLSKCGISLGSRALTFLILRICGWEGALLGGVLLILFWEETRSMLNTCKSRVVFGELSRRKRRLSSPTTD